MSIDLDNTIRKNLIDISNSIISLLDCNDITITGRNMSGKSDLLTYVIKKLRKKKGYEKVHFIDTVNRYVNFQYNSHILIENNQVLEKSLGKIPDIVSRRLLIEYLNNVDVFSGGEKYVASGYAYNFMRNLILEDNSFIKKINNFISDFNVSIELFESIPVLMKNEKIVNASNGLQALIRIFLEFYYANNKGVKYVFVDEMDSHFDNQICSRIVPLLKEYYPNIQIISTVHSLNFFENLNKNKLFIIEDELLNFKLVDCRDLSSFENINRVVFKSKKVEKVSDLQEIFVKVLNGIELSQTEIAEIKKDDLSPKEKILVNSIRDHISIE